MKRLTFQLISLLGLLVLALPNAMAQGLIFMKSGDTVHYQKIEDSYPNVKYWVDGSDKPIKVKKELVCNIMNFPKYELTTNEKDEFTGDIIKLTNFITIGMTKPDEYQPPIDLMILLSTNTTSKKTVYALTLKPKHKLGCGGAIDNYSLLKLKSGEVIRLDKDIARINCAEDAYSTYLIADSTLSKLKSQGISSIRLNQSKSFLDFSVVFPDCLIKSIEVLEK